MIGGGNSRGGKLRPLLLAGPLAFACAALWPAASQAFIGCSYSAGKLNVTLNETDDTVRIARGGSAINVIATGPFGEGPSVLLTCAGGSATVTNTDLIAVEEAATARFGFVSFELGGGQFAPGATPEADGTSEIELRANMYGPDDAIQVIATGTADAIHVGRLPSGATGANLNALGEAAPDVDLEMVGTPVVGVSAGAGNDVVRGRGSPGFAGPARIPIVAFGGPGRDLLMAGRVTSLISGAGGRDTILGSRGPDFLDAGRGRDLIKAGKGGDFAFALRGGVDRINCGGSQDVGLVDRKDRRRSCENSRNAINAVEETQFSTAVRERSFNAAAKVLRRK